MSFAHPMSQMGYLPQPTARHREMSGLFDDLKSWAEESITDPIRETVDDIIGEENREVLDAELQKVYDKERQALEQKALEEAAKLISGDKPKTGTSAAVSNIQAQIDEMNRTTFAAIPGGLYTVAGLGVVAIILLMRR